MHPEIAEASEKLNRRYVVNAPHCWAKWVGSAIRAEPTKPLAVKRPGIWAGSIRAGGDATRYLPSIGSLGGVAPLPGAVRRPSFLGLAALNPVYGGSIAHGAEGDSVAYFASSGGVGWVERSKTHRMNQTPRGRGGGSNGVAA